MMRPFFVFLAVGAFVAAAAVSREGTTLRVRLGNGATRKVTGKDLASVRREAGLREDEALFLDDACTQVAPESLQGLERGVLVYVRPRWQGGGGDGGAAQEKEEGTPKKKATSRFDPYPSLASAPRPRPSSSKGKRVASLRDVEARYHEIKRSETKVCAEARVVQEAFAAVYRREFSLVFGRLEDDRGRRRRQPRKTGGVVVICEAFGGDAEADVARRLGLAHVGCAVAAKDAKPTAAAIVAAAETQALAMKERQLSGGPFPFVLLVAADDGSALEAYEVSEHLVQLVAEGIVDVHADTFSSSDMIHTRTPVRVEERLTDSFDPEWVYRPVPVAAHSADFVFTHSADVDAVLRRHLRAANPLDAFADLRLLVRLRSLLTARDFETLCATLKARRLASKADRDAILLPRAFAAVLRSLAPKLGAKGD